MIEFPYASEAFKRLNPHLFVGGVEKPITQRNVAQALGRCVAPRQSRPDRLVLCITLTSYRRRLLDRDNLIGGLKPLRDAIAQSIGLDDNERGIKWDYHQLQTDGHQGTAVRIELI